MVQKKKSEDKAESEGDISAHQAFIIAPSQLLNILLRD